ncbi:MAG: Na/Pi cotransporter family protein, partial [Clostridia bacterium]|nr:Na/Pi cotransporter family protein [Clostridia bacterium]
MVYLILTLLGGIGLFLYGMNTMSSGLRNACGNNLKKILEKATRNKLTSILSGMIITILIQSSSATDVMVIGFVSSGLMTLEQAIGVIIGANIGTTITAQITAFDIEAFTPVLIFIGAVLYIFFKKNSYRSVGTIILGFGILFQGLDLIKTSIEPLGKSPAVMELVSGISNPFLTLLLGIIISAVLQSSSSATVIFQTFASQGIISYDTAVYLILGTTVGSLSDNMLASLSLNIKGKRAALLNLIFNVIRMVLMFTLVSLFPGIKDLIKSLSPDNVAR